MKLGSKHVGNKQYSLAGGFFLLLFISHLQESVMLDFDLFLRLMKTIASTPVVNSKFIEMIQFEGCKS